MYKGTKVYGIISAAGVGKRLGGRVPKQFLSIGGETVLQQTCRRFHECPIIDGIVISCNADYLDEYERELRAMKIESTEFEVHYVVGGKERQDSVFSAVRRVGEICDPVDFDRVIVAIHDCARPFVTSDLIMRTVESAYEKGNGVAALKSTDSLRHLKEGIINRDEIYRLQTPQSFRLSLFQSAMKKVEQSDFVGTDESSLMDFAGIEVFLVDGEESNRKITTKEDLPKLVRIGHGFDVHRLVEGRKLILGGVEIPYEKGLLGHSDADVIVHSIMDAILGAMAMGDIGKHFPDTDERFKGADSLKLLAHVKKLMDENGYSIINIDGTIICQAPKLRVYIDKMRENIAEVLSCSISHINLKATTTEKLGFEGEGLGISAHAVASLELKRAD